VRRRRLSSAARAAVHAGKKKAQMPDDLQRAARRSQSGSSCNAPRSMRHSYKHWQRRAAGGRAAQGVRHGQHHCQVRAPDRGAALHRALATSWACKGAPPAEGASQPRRARQTPALCRAGSGGRGEVVAKGAGRTVRNFKYRARSSTPKQIFLPAAAPADGAEGASVVCAPRPPDACTPSLRFPRPAASVWCRLLCGSPQPRAACRAGLGRVVDASPRADALSGGAESGGPVLRQAGGGPRARQPAAPARAPAAVRQGRRGGQPGDRQRGAPVRARDPPRGAALSRAAAACVAGPCPWRNSKHAAFGTISLAKVAYAYDTVARSGGKAPHAMNHLAEQGLRAIHLWCLPLPNVRHACTREASGARAAQARAEAARDDGAAARAGAARHGRQAAARRRAAGRAAGAGADAGGRARRRGRRGRGRAAEEGRRAGGAGAAAAAAGAPPLRGDRTGPCRARGLVRRCVGCGAGLSWAAPAWLRRMRKGLTRAVRRPWTAGGGAYLLPRQVCCRQMQSPLRPSKR